jgi:hypothetical protein
MPGLRAATQEGSHEACVDRHLRLWHSLKGHCRANVIMTSGTCRQHASNGQAPYAAISRV